MDVTLFRYFFSIIVLWFLLYQSSRYINSQGIFFFFSIGNSIAFSSFTSLICIWLFLCFLFTLLHNLQKRWYFYFCLSYIYLLFFFSPSRPAVFSTTTSKRRTIGEERLWLLSVFAKWSSRTVLFTMVATHCLLQFKFK